MVDEPGIGADFVAPHGHHAHGFGASGDDDLSAAAANAIGGHGNRLQAGGAEAVDGHGRRANRQAGAQGRDAGDVHSLLRLRHGTAQDHVFDLVAIKLGHAGEGAFDRGRGQIVGARRGQRTSTGLADGGSDSADDDGVSHIRFPFLRDPLSYCKSPGLRPG